MMTRVNLAAIEVPPYVQYSSITTIANKYRAQYNTDEYSIAIMEGDAKDAIIQAKHS